MMKNEQELRKEYEELIRKDPEKNRKGAIAIRENMERSPLFFRGDYRAKTLQIPRLYTEETLARFEALTEMTYGIFEKVIREYLKNADYRRLFPFPKELEELILLPAGYDCLLPLARFDIFYHEDTGDFGFCEINTDGASGMNEDRLLDEFFLDNPAHQEMRRRYRMRTFELFDSWVKEFLAIYETYERKKPHPNVAIVDFLDTGTLREFQEFARRFQRAGVDSEVCDIRELTFKDGKLLSPEGYVIDAVYRRAVTTDVMEHYSEVQPFLTAVKEGAVFLAGSFRTQIVHHKCLFHVLRLPETAKLLTEEERAFVEKHVPKTLPFAEGWIALEEVLKNKDRYIIKPQDSYASHGVYAGVEFTESEWEKKATEAYGKDSICQEYYPQYASSNIDYGWGDGEWHDYITMTGLFVYGGRFAGAYCRAAEAGGIIRSHDNERTQPTYIVSEKSL